MSKQSRTDKYKDLNKDEIGHILLRPDMYVGSVKPKIIEDYVAYEDEDGDFHIDSGDIIVAPAFVRTFVEVLSNAIDNVSESIKQKTPCTKIKITLDPQTGETCIWNDGAYIPIEKKGDTYVHTMLFGKLRTSSNYDDNEEREKSGRNGYGVTLCNVYSSKFRVRGADPEVGKVFSQEWKNNMRTVGKPIVKDAKVKTGFTEVRWTPDFEKFGLKGYTEDVIGLFYKYVLDTAMVTKVSVYLDGRLLPVRNLLDYAKMYITEETDEILHFKTKNSEVVLTPCSEYRVVSFANGVYTSKGGVHVDAWSEKLFRPLVNKFNKKDKPQVNISHIKQFFMLFVNTTVINPEFESQSKHLLEGPEVAASVPQKYITEIMKWSVAGQIQDIIDSKELIALKKTEGKGRNITVKKLDSANNSGGKLSSECILIVCEGDSAKTYATTGISKGVYGKTGRDWFGMYPLRGKILNVRNATIKQLTENEVIKDLIHSLKLKYDVDYTDDKNFNTLAYGMLMVLTDADVDGIHILGLILNKFHTLFPSLLQREKPFVVQMNTPIAKIEKIKKIFFDEREYNEFMKDSDYKHKSKYYKGLGTSERKEVKETFGLKMTEFIYDENADRNMVKVFRTDQADARKRWITQYDPEAYKEFNNIKKISQLDISDFLNHYMIQFSIADCGRSLPHMMDGLKESQRKILYACFKRKLKTELKVSQLAGYVAEHTNYHHGEQGLEPTIKGMCGAWVGGNNLPLLTRKGEMGSRMMGGKDAAAGRYVFTYLDEITRVLYPEEDDVLLETKYDDGQAVEPEFYVPIIPMVLINSCKAGIGTGWSTAIPGYNPLQICECIRLWLENNGEEIFDEDGKSIFPDLIPWYRDFKGTIEKTSQDRYTTHGVMEEVNEDTVLITELPIGTWTENYKEELTLMKNGQAKDTKKKQKLVLKTLKSIRNNSTPTEVYFEVTRIPGTCELNEKHLKLTSSLATSNMVMFTETGQIKRFDTVDMIIDRFCRVRFEYYVRRKVHLLKTWKNDFMIFCNRKRFVEEIMTKKLIIFQRDEDDVVAEMEEKGYDKQNDKYEYLLSMHMRSFTKNKITALQKEIDTCQKNIDNLEKTSEMALWLLDLDKFENAYAKLLKRLEEENVETDVGPKKRKKKKE